MHTAGLLAIAAAASTALASPMSEYPVETRSCSASFKNIVFNSGVDNEPDINWMNTVIGWASQQPVIERVF
ncbi:hypothetical protein CIB48_g9269 [Xylaria polymorpha]|nr:hypothetical protein CIB48_g9269 [Xylaria polymorpha]